MTKGLISLFNVEENIEFRKGFSLIYVYEPISSLSITELMFIVNLSKQVNLAGGKFLILIDDLTASQLSENSLLVSRRTESFALIISATKIPVNIYISTRIWPKQQTESQLGLSFDELFEFYVESTTKILVSDIQQNLSCKNEEEKEHLVSARYISPVRTMCEIIKINADFIVAPSKEKSLLFRLVQKLDSKVRIVLPVKIDLETIPNPLFGESLSSIKKILNLSFCTDDIVDNPIYNLIIQLFLPFYGTFEFENKTYASETELNNSVWKDFAKKILKERCAEILYEFVSPILKEKESQTPQLVVTQSGFVLQFCPAVISGNLLLYPDGTINKLSPLVLNGYVKIGNDGIIDKGCKGFTEASVLQSDGSILQPINLNPKKEKTSSPFFQMGLAFQLLNKLKLPKDQLVKDLLPLNDFPRTDSSKQAASDDKKLDSLVVNLHNGKNVNITPQLSSHIQKLLSIVNEIIEQGKSNSTIEALIGSLKSIAQ
jgi:hypothetical protein